MNSTDRSDLCDAPMSFRPGTMMHMALRWKSTAQHSKTLIIDAGLQSGISGTISLNAGKSLNYNPAEIKRWMGRERGSGRIGGGLGKLLRKSRKALLDKACRAGA
jgi:hypothetical protein